jgi:hypothetical protein
VLHEIVGHGGSALLVGVPVKAVSTTTVFIEWGRIDSAAEGRIIDLGGVVVNLLTGAVGLAILRYRKSSSVASRCFLWLVTTWSFIIAAMNLVTAPLLGGGDLAEATRGLEPRPLFVAGVVAFGAVVAIVGFRMPLRLWMPALEGNDRGLLRLYTVVPVATLVVVQTLSMMASPFSTEPLENNHMAACVLAYLHFALWALLVNVILGPRGPHPVEGLHLERSQPWLAVGLAVALFFILVLGPGLGPLGDDPRLG